MAHYQPHPLKTSQIWYLHIQGFPVKEIGDQVFVAGISKGFGGRVGNYGVYDFRTPNGHYEYETIYVNCNSLTNVVIPDSVEKIIKSKDRTKASKTAPAEGLYLTKVIY